MRKFFYKYLSDIFKENNKVAILLGDIGVFSFKSSFELDSSRIYNLGILEQSMIGISSALSSNGFIPFVHSIAPFITERCFEQLKLDLAYENRNVFIVSVGNSYDYSALGVTHHCPGDLRIISSIPNFKTFCPGNCHDVKKIIDSELFTKYPKYIRLSEVENNLTRSCDDLEILKNGNKGIIIIIGNSIKKIDKLLNSSIDATILYSCNVSDFNFKKLNNIISDNNLIKKITVIEPSYSSGIIEKICINSQNIVSINSISVPFYFIDKYGNKNEIDIELELDDYSIIKKLEKIYL